MAASGFDRRSAAQLPIAAERTIWASGVPRLARPLFRLDAVIDAADLAPVLESVRTHIVA
ncbi:hypothetical protein ACWT_5406 [Actinoplanes sp. SE50]|uniref:hypothetical protein n=1 Tax=unclassified Actinoplanes TaxID=2626549 RepID=UPI00023EC4EE|nr:MULTISPECIES: hypothetical protein [unclassified Actinoplanes]AEV86424.1 hypothetical protein ACPL_5537 [Actinoplanes sp. SE50/110]ATO84821.1 hypothetical protein ACWT_5406 [Actinoplanes sp. SE50]SLM02231.1 hypothetical protein ACSP50_5469 [Actinoplanes sp. SE50/110]